MSQQDVLQSRSPFKVHLGSTTSPHHTASAIPATAESRTTATEPALNPKRTDEAPLKLPEIVGEAALPLALPEPEAPAAGVVLVAVVPKPEPVGVVVTV